MNKTNKERQDAYKLRQKAENKKPLTVYIAKEPEAVEELHKQVKRINRKWLK